MVDHGAVPVGEGRWTEKGRKPAERNRPRRKRSRAATKLRIYARERERERERREGVGDRIRRRGVWPFG